jgi:glycosyltransferase involved in cell wall biosynthesis
LEQAFAPHGFSRLSEQLALFGRNAAEPAPAADATRPHVLLYTDDPEHGGVAHYNHSLLLALARAGHRVTCMQTQSEGELVAAQRAAGVRHHWIDYDTSSEFARTLTDGKAALKILAADRPDLVILSDCCPLSNLAAREAARQLGIPYVVVIGFVGAYLAETFAGQLPVLAAQYAAARAVVAVSQENLDLLHTRFGLAKDHGQVIHYGRPEEFFKPRDEAVRARLRASLGVPAEAVVCFTAARLTGVKRHDLQLEAITQLMAGRTGSDLHFVWAGDGDQRVFLEKEIQHRGLARCVHLLGQRTDVRDWYDAADIFVLPSQLEGMPLAIMEAMAKGLPVVATAVSGIPEELGDTGKLLPDPAADPRGVVRGLTGTISNWAANPAVRDTVGRRGRERAERMFREATMIGHTVALIRRHLPATAPACAATG